MRLGNFLKNRRKDLGLTQVDLGKKLGYSNGQFISNWERGLSGPPEKKINKLCRVLGVNKKWLEEIL